MGVEGPELAGLCRQPSEGQVDTVAPNARQPLARGDPFNCRDRRLVDLGQPPVSERFGLRNGAAGLKPSCAGLFSATIRR